MAYIDKVKKQMDENKDYNSNSGGSDWFKFVEGDNTFRLLTEPAIMFEKFKVGICYTDCGYQGSPKFLCWVADSRDGKVKLAKLPYTLGEQVLALETDADYGFTGFPMPYSITIKAVGAGTKEVKYSAPLPRPKKELPINIADAVQKLKSPEEIIEKMKANQKEKHIADGTWQANQEARKKEVEEVAAARAAGGGKVEPPIPYPEEEINPDDIPF